MKNRELAIRIKNGIYLVLALVILSFALSFTSLGLLESVRIVFGSVFVLFLPGFIISYIFFPETKELDDKENSVTRARVSPDGQIDWIERIALSFALSIAIVPLAVFYLNLVGVRINFLNSFLTILGIIIISFGILYWKKRK
jgi:uncharacterized membrane protein